MDSIQNFLSSHPYAETTKRTYADILSRFLQREDPATITADRLIKYVQSRRDAHSSLLSITSVASRPVHALLGATTVCTINNFAAT